MRSEIMNAAAWVIEVGGGGEGRPLLGEDEIGKVESDARCRIASSCVVIFERYV